ncbi:MAG: hypothetical protein QMD36_04755 [Candidatus Aenigmarchaeota archaeon]|nr:hypothetical protein [Candidatus Aenigmarchaeota archaeon]
MIRMINEQGKILGNFKLEESLYEQAMEIVKGGNYRSFGELARTAIRELAIKYGKWIPKDESVYDVILERRLQSIGSRYAEHRN